MKRKKPESALEEALRLVDGARMADYGPPALNHGCTAALWSAYLSRALDLEIALDAEDVCWLNVLQKVSRQANERKRDNVVDAVGYLENIDRL